ncbi:MULTISPECIES: ATP-binding protein [unclassified Streptomyces]|uniref:ATP-binding protein n=1 Tax=unclassified Streptomyces TaxID=2593676 RepID=UPI003812AF22
MTRAPLRQYARQEYAVADMLTPAAARAFTAAQLDHWHVPDEPRDDAVQIASELVANAVAHGAGGHVQVALYRVDHTLTVMVTDQGGHTGIPCLRLPDAGAESGRGLLLVAALSRNWDWHHRETGLVVWAEVSLRLRRSPHGSK